MSGITITHLAFSMSSSGTLWSLDVISSWNTTFASVNRSAHFAGSSFAAAIEGIPRSVIAARLAILFQPALILMSILLVFRARRATMTRPTSWQSPCRAALSSVEMGRGVRGAPALPRSPAPDHQA